MGSAPMFADRPAEATVGESWAYRHRANGALVEVVVEKIGVKRPKRVLIRFVGDEFEGLRDWVPPGRLRAPWQDVDAFTAWERRWAALLELSPDSVEERAAGVVFDLLIDAELAELGYNYTTGTVRLHDVVALAAYLGMDPADLTAHPLAFQDEGSIVAPWPVARSVATIAAARRPEVVLRHVAKEEAEARREATFGHYSRPVGKFDDGFISPEVCAAIDDEHGKPVRAVLRAWCGEGGVELRDEITELREQLRRQSAIAESAVRALRAQGAQREAASIERELGSARVRPAGRTRRRSTTSPHVP